MNDIKESFRRFAARAAQAFGSPWAFGCAVLVVLAWAAAGPLFHYSDQWQLIINTGTTIGTFLLVFVLQNTQIRDTKALHLKLDELLRAIDGARTGLVNVDTLSDDELDRLYVELQRLGRKEGISAVIEDEQLRGGVAVAPSAESCADVTCSPAPR
jgi:low affinity Fe/Cu permease